MFRDETQLLNSSINYNIKYRCYVDSLFSVHPKLGVGELTSSMLTSSMLLLHSRYFYLVFVGSFEDDGLIFNDAKSTQIFT